MTREEALQAIKARMDYYESNKRLRCALETLIPELVESEDESIRKWLLDFAIGMIAGLESDISRSTYDGIKGHDPESEAELAQWQKARAYLEKQKEQKSAEWSEEEYGRLFDIEHYLDGTLLLSPDRRIACIDFLKYLRSQSHWKPSEVCYGVKGDPDPAGTSDLEEAAENYIAPIENDEGLDYINFNGRDIKDAFIAGAEWQKEQMMKEAVEGVIVQDLLGFLHSRSTDALDEKRFKYRDKVKIIIVKQYDPNERP